MFSEGWFRNSGLYDIESKYQKEFIENFKADKCNWSSIKCNKESKKYIQWQNFIQISENVDEEVKKYTDGHSECPSEDETHLIKSFVPERL